LFQAETPDRGFRFSQTGGGIDGEEVIGVGETSLRDVGNQDGAGSANLFEGMKKFSTRECRAPVIEKLTDLIGRFIRRGGNDRRDPEPDAWAYTDFGPQERIDSDFADRGTDCSQQCGPTPFKRGFNETSYHRPKASSQCRKLLASSK